MNYEDLIKNAISKNEVVQLLCGSGGQEQEDLQWYDEDLLLPVLRTEAAEKT